MIGAAKRKSISPVSLAAVRVLLLLVVTLCLGQTRVWGFGVTPQPASGVFESVTPSSVRDFTTAWQYDASDSLLVAKTASTAEQLANLARFEKKLPANATPTKVFDLPNGGKAFQADSASRNILGSFAQYEKQVDAAGNTLQYTKTTFGPNGEIIHVKDKIGGGTFP